MTIPSTCRPVQPPRPAVPHRPATPAPALLQPDAPPPHTLYDAFVLAQRFGFVVPEAVLPDLVAASRDDALRTLVAALAEAGAVPDGVQQQLLADLRRREEFGSSGIGCGVALPHTRHAAAFKPAVALGYCRHGIDFDAPDALPVQLIFLLISPPGTPHANLQIFQAISQLLLSLDKHGPPTADRYGDD